MWKNDFLVKRRLPATKQVGLFVAEGNTQTLRIRSTTTDTTAITTSWNKLWIGDVTTSAHISFSNFPHHIVRQLAIETVYAQTLTLSEVAVYGFPYSECSTKSNLWRPLASGQIFPLQYLSTAGFHIIT